MKTDDAEDKHLQLLPLSRSCLPSGERKFSTQVKLKGRQTALSSLVCLPLTALISRGLSVGQRAARRSGGVASGFPSPREMTSLLLQACAGLPAIGDGSINAVRVGVKLIDRPVVGTQKPGNPLDRTASVHV